HLVLFHERLEIHLALRVLIGPAPRNDRQIAGRCSGGKYDGNRRQRHHPDALAFHISSSRELNAPAHQLSRANARQCSGAQNTSTGEPIRGKVCASEMGRFTMNSWVPAMTTLART